MGQIKKKKALAGHFVGEDGTFASKKGKKQKEPAASTAQVEVPEPAKEPEIVKEPEEAEITNEKKKPTQVKKKKALAGHFVGEDGSFGSKKGKKQKEPAASTAQVEVPEPAKEPEIVKEPEVAEISDEKKKP